MIEGILYKQRSSVNKKSILLISNNFFYIKVGEDIDKKGDIKTLDISSRIGNIERKITLEDGSVFATKDNDSVDRLILEGTKERSILHAIETNALLIFLSLLFTVLFSVTFFKWGIPYISKQVAYVMPVKVNEIIASNTLELLDSYVFKPSELESFKKDAIKSTFVTQLLPLVSKNSEIKYEVHFRMFKQGDKSIANAFALPNGDIVLTDEFIQLSQNQDEISSVILHEMGHVKERHGLQRLIQSSFIAVMIMFVSGDTTMLGDMGIGLGTLFLTSNYSREHELEADLFAFKKMLIAKIDPENFVNIMSKISENKEKEVNKENDIVNYLSSHPDTLYRINIAKKYSKCFKKGQSICQNK